MAPGTLALELRRAGFTHLLLAEGEGPGALHYNGTLKRLVAEAQQAGAAGTFACLAEEVFAESNGSRRRYRLFELRWPPQGWAGASSQQESVPGTMPRRYTVRWVRSSAGS